MPEKHKIIQLFGFLILLALGIALVSCQSATGYAARMDPTNTPQTIVLTADLTHLDRQVAFMPVDPTAVSQGAIFPTATPDGNAGQANNGEGSSGASSGESGPVPLLKLPEDQVNIMLLGTDQRPYEGGFRTDVILLVSINLDSQTINMVSFPRDLYVTLPGYYTDRINSAQFRGGFPLLASTLEYNFGFRPDYYGMINLFEFKSLIDTLGGVTVNVGQTLWDERTGYKGGYTVPAGTVTMDGDTALWYVRSRKTTSDFDRTRRQQEVVLAIIRRMMSFDVVTKFPTLYEQFNGIIETNLPLSAVTPLLPSAANFVNGNIGTYAVGPNLVTNWVTPSGSQVLLPNKPAIQQMLRTALNAQ